MGKLFLSTFAISGRDHVGGQHIPVIEDLFLQDQARLS